MARILIVDDEAENRANLKFYLEKRGDGWEIETAANELEAADRLSYWVPDVVVTDLVMQGKQSGMEVLRSVKEHDPFIMVILMTAYEKELDRYKAFRLGAFDCVQKNVPGVVAAEEILIKTRAALAFKELTQEQIEAKSRIALLGSYFDQRVFGVIQENPSLLDLRSAIVTVCFWDIRGFSRLSETLKGKPKLLSEFLRDYFDMAAQTIFEFNGVLDKFIGDGVMGLFGALTPVDEEGHLDAVGAVHAAVVLRERFAALQEKWLQKWTLHAPQMIDIGLGAGIHTGEVLVGNIGATSRNQFTAIGPNVNFAQRLESRSAKGQILVSASTEARVRDHFKLEEVEAISDIKNIQGEFRLYQVISSRL